MATVYRFHNVQTGMVWDVQEGDRVRDLKTSSDYELIKVYDSEQSEEEEQDEVAFSDEPDNTEETEEPDILKKLKANSGKK